MKKKMCMRCRGSGQIVREKENRFDYREETCPDCGGTGKSGKKLERVASNKKITMKCPKCPFTTTDFSAWFDTCPRCGAKLEKVEPR